MGTNQASGDRRPAANCHREDGSHHGHRDYAVGLFGVFGCGNFGNDATLEACLLGLEKLVPKSRIACIATNAVAVNRAYGVASFPIAIPPSLAGGGRGLLGRVRRGLGELGNLVRAWRVLRRVRTFVIAGTGVLDDQHTRPNHLPLDVFRWSLAARLAGTRLVFLAVGAGPIEQRWSRILLVPAARLAHEVSYRDQRSMNFMRSLGRDVTRDRVVPDLVLATVPPEVAHRRPDGQARRLVIGLLWQKNWSGRPQQYMAYESRMIDLIMRFSAAGWEISLVNGDEADVGMQQAIVRRPELAGLRVFARGTHSFHDVLHVAMECDAMVASRYHNVVAAVIAGVPVISLGYGPKNIGLLEELGAAQWALDIDDFSVDEAFEQILLAMRNAEPLFRDRLKGCRHLLQRELEVLALDA